jgi:hypothetical protein
MLHSKKFKTNLKVASHTSEGDKKRFRKTQLKKKWGRMREVGDEEKESDVKEHFNKEDAVAQVRSYFPYLSLLLCLNQMTSQFD